MKEVKATQTGLLRMYGSAYAVLLPETNSESLPVKPWQASGLHVEHRTITLLVAAVHFVEHVQEGIIMGVNLFVTPRWISLNGDFMIEWLPEQKEVTVLVPADGETINE